MNCPKCGGEMWDNRVDKKNPKSPDYKCKDKNCAHPIWLGKYAPASGAEVPAKRVVPVGGQPGAKSDWLILQERYENCIGVATQAYHAIGKTLSDEAFVSAVAALFIQASKEQL